MSVRIRLIGWIESEFGAYCAGFDFHGGRWNPADYSGEYPADQPFSGQKLTVTLSNQAVGLESNFDEIFRNHGPDDWMLLAES